MIARNRFAGALSDEVQRLTSMQVVDLQNNKFIGSLPEVGLRMLTGLTDMFACNNRFQGVLPEEGFLRATSLRFVYLQDNSFAGKVSYGIDALTNLRLFMLGNNLLSGTLRLPAKRMLCLTCDRNLLEGSLQVPWRVLWLLDAGYNLLAGSIPPDVGLSGRLGTLALTDMMHRGTVPSSLSRMTGIYGKSFWDPM
eukprot:43136-Amphidinium_carterae.1